MQEPKIIIMDFDITSIVYFLLGAIASGIIGYIFAKRREKQLLKLKLQFETVETLQTMFTKYIEISSKVISLHITKIEFDMYNNSIPNKLNDGLVEFNKQILRQRFEEWDNYYQNYVSGLCSILFLIEMRQIILIKFQCFHKEIGLSLRTLQEKYIKLLLSKSDIYEKLTLGEIIDNDKANEILLLIEEVGNIIFDIDAYMIDFEIGLQNEFYRKIFKTKIPERKPMDPNYKVLSPQNNRASFLP